MKSSRVGEWDMDETELIYFAVAMTVVVLATASAWIESRLERHDAPDYVRLLRHNRRYREHVARGPVDERRRAGRRRPGRRPPEEGPRAGA